ncbi:hypothetical protein [Sphingobacterium spiritivorum]|uniref:hypothetical protein n=1 Tax=Sphingobacterium spiritivorum TaxID=258 RepID=UPI003DA4EBB4
MNTLNLNGFLSFVSDSANANCTNKGFETQFLYLQIKQANKLEKALNAFKTSTSITFVRVNIYSEAEFEIITPSSVDSQIVSLPYINGIEKIEGYSNINFNLAELLTATFETDQLNEMLNILPKKTYEQIRKIKEREFHEELFGSDYQPEIDDPTFQYPNTLLNDEV